MRVLVTALPTRLEVSLSLSLRRRFFLLLVPEELRLLEAVAVAAELSRRLVWLWPEPEVRDTVTLVGGGLGDRRSLRTEGGRHLDDRHGGRQSVQHRDVSHCCKWLFISHPLTLCGCCNTSSRSYWLMLHEL